MRDFLGNLLSPWNSLLKLPLGNLEMKKDAKFPGGCGQRLGSIWASLIELKLFQVPVHFKTSHQRANFSHAGRVASRRPKRVTLCSISCFAIIRKAISAFENSTGHIESCNILLLKLDLSRCGHSKINTVASRMALIIPATSCSFTEPSIYSIFSSKGIRTRRVQK
jgi:hypothetical protein